MRRHFIAQIQHVDLLGRDRSDVVGVVADSWIGLSRAGGEFLRSGEDFRAGHARDTALDGGSRSHIKWTSPGASPNDCGAMNH